MLLNPSIRRRLLLVLTSVLLLGWCATTVWIYLDTRYEIEEVYDATLAQTARLIRALINANPDSLEDAASADREILLDPRGSGHRYESKIAFLATTFDGERRFHSPGAPKLPLPSGTVTYYNATDGDTAWRVFVLQEPELGLVIQTAQKDEVREELVRFITFNTLAPLLLTAPLIALLTWLSVGASLRPLKRVAAAVSRRSPESLAPLDTLQVPEEALPMVDAMNGLFQRLEEAFERERRFTADAAHELRTPLAALKTQLQVAMRANDPAVRARALHQVEIGVDRATRLLEQLLTLARMDAAAPSNPLNRMDLRVVAAETIALLVPDALRRGVDVDLDLREAGDFLVPGDPGSSAILLRNLIDNAVRHSPAPGQVNVSIDSQRDAVVLCVTDQGPGIPTAERERVFQRFSRGEQAGPDGSGLGLSIAQRIAALHGTRVLLMEGPSGLGLRACVRFPRNGR